MAADGHSAAGPVVLVTGCSSGTLGAALAKGFNARGCRVFASARRPAAMADLPGGVERVELDVTCADDCAAAVQRVVEAAGRIDILVNNAGFATVGGVATLPLATLRTTLETNVVGPVCLIQQALPHMQRQGGGTVVNISSAFENTFFPFNGTYAASKCALRCLSDTLRLELAPSRISIMHVAPGTIATPMLAPADTERSAPAWQQQGTARALAAFEAMYQRLMLPSAWAPEDAARVIVTAALRPRGPPARVYLGGLWWSTVAASWLPTWLLTLIFRLWFGLWFGPPSSNVGGGGKAKPA